MAVIIHPHARERMEERGATDEEVIKTVEEGEEFPAQFGRVGLRRNFTVPLGDWEKSPRL